MHTVLMAASDGAIAMAALVGVIGFTHAADPRTSTASEIGGAIGLVLQFLTAAGLFRLVLHPRPTVLALTVFVIVIRRVVVFGLTQGRRALAT